MQEEAILAKEATAAVPRLTLSPLSVAEAAGKAALELTQTEGKAARVAAAAVLTQLRSLAALALPGKAMTAVTLTARETLMEAVVAAALAFLAALAPV